MIIGLTQTPASTRIRAPKNKYFLILGVVERRDAIEGGFSCIEALQAFGSYQDKQGKFEVEIVTEKLISKAYF